MKKLPVILALLLVFALALSGCTSGQGGKTPAEPSFILDTGEDAITVTADSAQQGQGGVGFLTFGENEYLSYQLDGEGEDEVLRIVIFVNDQPDNPTAYTDPDAEDCWLDFTVQNGTNGMIGIEPGDYAFNISVDSETFTGIGKFTVCEDDITGIANPWEFTESAEEAAAAMGWGFEAPDDFQGLSPMLYSYSQELQMIDITYAEEMPDGTGNIKGDIRKAVAGVTDPNESLAGVWEDFDEEKEVNGVKLSIRDGLVRVAEWEAGGYRYSIYHQDGLSEEDMLAAVQSVK